MFDFLFVQVVSITSPTEYLFDDFNAPDGVPFPPGKLPLGAPDTFQQTFGSAGAND